MKQPQKLPETWPFTIIAPKPDSTVKRAVKRTINRTIRTINPIADIPASPY